MPTPGKDEKEKDFVSRCIPIVLEEGTAKDQSQAAAICHSMYRKAKETKDMKLVQKKKGGAEIYIYNEIDSLFGFTAEQLINEAKELSKDSPLTVHINSAGGEVFEGLAIYDFLRGWKGEVTTIAEGVAASISSVIFLAGDKRLMAPNAYLMVHNPLISALSGNRKDLESKLELLKKAESTVINIYKSRTSVTEDQLVEWLDAETYLTATDAIETGFAHDIAADVPEVTAKADLRSLVAKINGALSQGEIEMKFESWLKAYCEPLGTDPAKLTDEQKKNLKAVFEKQSSSSPGGKEDASKLRDDLTAGLREAAARETERVTAIEQVASDFKGVTLNEDTLKNLGARGKTSKALQSVAIRENWTLDKFELELRRAQKQDLPTPGVHIKTPVSELMGEKQVLLASMCKRLMPESVQNQKTGKKYGYKHYFKEEVLEAADNPQIANIGIRAIMSEAIFAAEGQHIPAYSSGPEFMNRARNALWTLRASGSNTTWGGLNIFDDLANKLLLNAYNAQETTWQEWVYPVTVNDFKTHNLYRFDLKGGYLKLGADGELKHGDMTDAKYTVAADTYGRILGLTRHDIINDDLGALDRIMSILGEKAAVTVEEMIYVYLLGNLATLFPTAGTYGNYMSGAGTVIGVDGLSEGVELFRKMVRDDGSPLLVNPSILVTGVGNEVVANELYSERALQGLQTANTKRRPDNNPHTGKYRPVTTPYIDNTSITQISDFNGELAQSITGQTSTGWMLCAQPSAGNGSIVNAAFLDGKRTPTLESADQSFEFLGMQWRGYLDAGVGSGDPKLAIWSKGAA